jgi:hypothetical protein
MRAQVAGRVNLLRQQRRRLHDLRSALATNLSSSRLLQYLLTRKPTPATVLNFPDDQIEMQPRGNKRRKAA